MFQGLQYVSQTQRYMFRSLQQYFSLQRYKKVLNGRKFYLEI